MTAPVLVTGGAGYIGPHMVSALLQAGHQVAVLDNLSNSSPRVLARVGRMAGRASVFVRGYVRDAALLRPVLAEHGMGAVLHFASLKAVGESVRDPLRYYEHNVAGHAGAVSGHADNGGIQLVGHGVRQADAHAGQRGHTHWATDQPLWPPHSPASPFRGD